MANISWDEIFACGSINNPIISENTDNAQAEKLLLVVSLLKYLKFSLASFLESLFASENKVIRNYIGQWLSYRPSRSSPYPPKTLFDIVHHSYPARIADFHKYLIVPCAHELMEEESDRLLKEPLLRVKMENCTISQFQESLAPLHLASLLRDRAPILFDLLITFSAKPTESDRKRARSNNLAGVDLREELDSTYNQSADEEDEIIDLDYSNKSFKEFEGWADDFRHFKRKCILPIVCSFQMLLAKRSSRINVLSLPMGLFARISGADTRLINVLNQTGITVSYWSIERAKENFSNDAVQQAKNLVLSNTDGYFTIFDNLNIYLRKYDQRITNQNVLLSITNTAIVALPGVPKSGFDLTAFLSLRGNRKKASIQDLVINQGEHDHMKRAMTPIVAQLLWLYFPGSNDWSHRQEMKDNIQALLPTDRPIPAVKTRTYPFGTFDINEGTKRGCIDVIEAILEKTGLSDEEWTKQVRLILGDWLSVALTRAARRERAEDFSAKEQLINIKELSALWHYALNAITMIIKFYVGSNTEDPGALSAHKARLSRIWDINKPNYAAAKSLVRHSLIARLIDIIMEIQGYSQYSELKKWKPSFSELQKMCQRIVEEFATSKAGTLAKQHSDDWLANSIYFIRDSLIFLVFEKYVSIADAGGVLRVFKIWTYQFRGAGLTNYARETLEVLSQETF